MTKRIAILLEFCLVAALLLLFHTSLRGTYLYIFQERDLARAADILGGEWLFAGPELTGGGNLPGAFYYYLLAAALWVKPVWLSSWWLMMGFAAAGGALFWVWVRRVWGWLPACAGLFCFAYSPILQRVYSYFLNVSYLPFFTCIAVIGLLGAYCGFRHARLFWYAAVVGMALALQLHFSAISLLFATLIAQFFARRFGFNPVKKWDFAGGIALFFLSLLPYLWSLLSGFQPVGELLWSPTALGKLVPANLGDPSFRWGVAIWAVFINNFPPALLALLIILRGRLWVQPEVKLLGLIILMSLPGVFYSLLVPIGFRYPVVFAVAMAFLFAFSLVCLERGGEGLPARLWTALWILLAALSTLIIAAAVLPNTPPDADHYASGALFLAKAALVAGIGWLCSRRSKAAAFYAWVNIATFMGAMYFASPFLQQTRNPMDSMPVDKEWNEALPAIYAETGWDFETLRRRTYLLNMHLEASVAMPAPTEVKSYRSPTSPEGAIIAVAKDKNDQHPSAFRAWMLTQKIPPELRQALEQDEILFTRISSAGRLVFALYRWRKAGLALQNVGYGYSEHRPLPLPAFSWDPCRPADVNCPVEIGAEIRVAGAGEWELHAVIDGYSLGQRSEWVNPEASLALIRPWVEIQCGAQRERHFLLESIGYDSRYTSRALGMMCVNNSLLAPFTRHIRFSCTTTPKLLAAGAEGVRLLSRRREFSFQLETQEWRH